MPFKLSLKSFSQYFKVWAEVWKIRWPQKEIACIIVFQIWLIFFKLHAITKVRCRLLYQHIALEGLLIKPLATLLAAIPMHSDVL